MLTLMQLEIMSINIYYEAVPKSEKNIEGWPVRYLAKPKGKSWNVAQLPESNIDHKNIFEIIIPANSMPNYPMRK